MFIIHYLSPVITVRKKLKARRTKTYWMCFKIEVTLFKELRAVVYQCDDRDENEHHNGHDDESNHDDLQREKLILRK